MAIADHPLARLPGFFKDVIQNRCSGSMRPRLLTYTVTFRCNAKCIMCDSWKMSGQGDLVLTEIESIFRQIGRLDAVRLTGGEPFVRTDLPDIYRLAVEHLRPMGIHITSNGFLTDRIVQFCESRDPRLPLQLMISLDGVGEAHNRIRGSSIAWKTASETLQQLASRRKAWNIDLAVNQTIVDESSLVQYRELKRELKPLGIRHQVVMAYDTSATYHLEKGVDLAPKQMGEFTSFGKFPKRELNEFFDEVERDFKDLPWWVRRAKQYYLNGIRQRLDPASVESIDDSNANESSTEPSSRIPSSPKPSIDWVNPPCVALHSHLRLFPNGDVPTCQFNSKVIGNLRDQSFEEVWTNAQAVAQRKWVRECPGCWAECEVLPNAIYSLDVLRRPR